jgi:hypothetical protein
VASNSPLAAGSARRVIQEAGSTVTSVTTVPHMWTDAPSSTTMAW